MCPARFTAVSLPPWVFILTVFLPWIIILVWSDVTNSERQSLIIIFKRILLFTCYHLALLSFYHNINFFLKYVHDYFNDLFIHVQVAVTVWAAELPKRSWLIHHYLTHVTRGGHKQSRDHYNTQVTCGGHRFPLPSRGPEPTTSGWVQFWYFLPFWLLAKVQHERQCGMTLVVKLKLKYQILTLTEPSPSCSEHCSFALSLYCCFLWKQST